MAWSKGMTGEEDEEQLVMRRLRNSVDDLRRGLRHLTYKVTPVQPGPKLSISNSRWKRWRWRQRSLGNTERGSSYWRAPSVWPGSQHRSEPTFHRGRSSSTARTTRVEPRLPGWCTRWELWVVSTVSHLSWYQGCKLNNRSLHNFRPIIGKASINSFDSPREKSIKDMAYLIWQFLQEDISQLLESPTLQRLLEVKKNDDYLNQIRIWW